MSARAKGPGNKKKPLISKKEWIWLGVIAGVLAAVLLPLILTSKPAEKAPPKTMTDFDIKDIKSVDISGTGMNDLNFRVGADGRWMMENDPSFPVDATRASQLLGGCSYMQVKDFVGETNDLAKYGLDTPQRTISFSVSSGKAVKILLGRQTDDGTGRYAMLAGDKQVFSVQDWVNKALSLNKNDFYNRKPTAVNWWSANFHLYYESGYDITLKNMQPGVVGQKLPLFMIESPFKAYVDPLFVDSYISDLSSFIFDEYVGEDTDLAKYGLDKPLFILGATDSDGKKVEIRFGNADENAGFIYAMYTDAPHSIYKSQLANADKVVKDTLSSVIGSQAFYYPVLDAAYYIGGQQIDLKKGVQSITFDRAGVKDIMEISQSGDGKYTYKLNSLPMDETRGSNLADSVLEMAVSGQIKQKDMATTPDVTISINGGDFIIKQCAFYSNGDYYAIDQGLGSTELGIKRDTLKQILSDVDAFKTGK